MRGSGFGSDAACRVAVILRLMGISVGEVSNGASALPYQRGVIKIIGPHRWAACGAHGMPWWRV